MKTQTKGPWQECHFPQAILVCQMLFESHKIVLNCAYETIL